MVCYEVNIIIATQYLEDYRLWLTRHIQEMLQLPGFINAQVLKEYGLEDRAFSHLTIQYTLDNPKSLQLYFDNHAQRMREQSLKLFSGKFTATRRMFEILQH